MICLKFGKQLGAREANQNTDEKTVENFAATRPLTKARGRVTTQCSCYRWRETPLFRDQRCRILRFHPKWQRGKKLNFPPAICFAPIFVQHCKRIVHSSPLFRIFRLYPVFETVVVIFRFVLYTSETDTSTSTPASMLIDVICLTTSCGEYKSIRRL